MLGHELDKVKKILLVNGYTEDVIWTCFRGKIANFSSGREFGSEKCPVRLNIFYILSKFESQIEKGHFTWQVKCDSTIGHICSQIQSVPKRILIKISK